MLTLVHRLSHHLINVITSFEQHQLSYYIVLCLNLRATRNSTSFSVSKLEKGFRIPDHNFLLKRWWLTLRSWVTREVPRMHIAFTATCLLSPAVEYRAVMATHSLSLLSPVMQHLLLCSSVENEIQTVQTTTCSWLLWKKCGNFSLHMYASWIIR